jgi:hypothetical protein
MKLKMTMVVLATYVGSFAWAEGTKEDWAKLAQPTVNVFATCTLGEVNQHWESEAEPWAVARDAIARCEDRLEPLNKVLAAEPFSEQQTGIDQTIGQIKSEARAVIIADVEKRRKGN